LSFGLCSPFIVAGGSTYSLTMGNSSNDKELMQGFISTMSVSDRLLKFPHDSPFSLGLSVQCCDSWLVIQGL
jgi:hypothetical protein